MVIGFNTFFFEKPGFNFGVVFMHSPELPVLVPHLYFCVWCTQYSEIFDDFVVTIPCYIGAQF